MHARDTLDLLGSSAPAGWLADHRADGSRPERHRALHLRPRRPGTLDASRPGSRMEHTDMETKKLLMSLGTAIAASKVAKTVSNIEIEDVLGTLGLSRRRSHFLENL